jgi:hypothetical protein
MLSAANQGEGDTAIYCNQHSKFNTDDGLLGRDRPQRLKAIGISEVMRVTQKEPPAAERAYPSGGKTLSIPLPYYTV